MTDDIDLQPRAAADQGWAAEKKRSEREADRRRFKPIPFKGITLNTSRPYLVRGLVPREGLIVIWGPPKCGKTFWTLDVAMHVALGWRYRGHRVHQGGVVYLAAEGKRGLSARIEGFKQRKLGAGNHNPPFYLLSTRLHLVKDIKDLIRDIRVTLGDTQVVLIVIDTLNRTMTGSESNDADMTAYIGAADQLREAFSAAITIIHHCGVNGDRPRGHTSLGGAVDAQISVKKDATGVHTIVEWMKDGPEGEATVSRLVPVEVGVDDDGDPISSLVVEEIEAADQQRRSDRKKVQPNLSPKQQIALDQLRKAISAYGQPAPPHNYIPTNAPVVSTELWRRFYLSGTSADEQNDNTRRKAWRDARDALQAKGVIGICDEMVWEL